jgi:two-component system, cell cycle response regulator
VNQPAPGSDVAALQERIRALETRLQQFAADAKANQKSLQRVQEQELELLRAASLAEFLQRATLGLKTAYDLDAVSLVIEDPHHEVRHLLVGSGEQPNEMPGVSFVDTLANLTPQLPALQRPWLGRFVRPDHQLLFPGVEGLQSLALLPLRRAHRSMAVIAFGARDPERFTYHMASDFLAHLAAVAAVCLENACNRARVLKSGLSDYLTGWHTRRYLNSRLREELARAQRRGSSLACAMIDLDHFKTINDSFGHLAGDEVLREVTARIDALIRASDVAVRFGGDELALLLPETDAESARVLVRRIQAAMESPVEFAENRSWSVTLSLGVATVQPTRRDVDFKALSERLLADADAALYRAKEAGRNRLVVSGDPDPLP